MEKKKNGLGVASLILGILGIIICEIGFIPALLALILGVSSNKKGKNGAAKAGIVLGIIGMVIQIIATVVLIIIISTVGLATIFAIDNTSSGSSSKPPVTSETGNSEIDLTSYYENIKLEFDDSDPSKGVITIVEPFGPETYFFADGFNLDQVYTHFNDSFQSKAAIGPLSENLFYDMVTVMVQDDNYWISAGEQDVALVELYLALAYVYTSEAQLAANTAGIDENPHIERVEGHSGSGVYTAYLDNGMEMEFATSLEQNESTGEECFFNNISVNGDVIGYVESTEGILAIINEFKQIQIP